MNNIRLPASYQIIVVSCLLFALVMVFGVLWLKYTDLSFLQKTIKGKKAELAEEEQYFAKLSQTEEDLSQYKANLAKIDSALPNDPSLASLFNFLQQVSSQTGLVLKGISPPLVDTSETSSLKEIHLNLQLTGSYSSFKSFVASLEKSARLVEIENISFTSPKEGDVFTFNLRIQVFGY